MHIFQAPASFSRECRMVSTSWSLSYAPSGRHLLLSLVSVIGCHLPRSLVLAPALCFERHYLLLSPFHHLLAVVLSLGVFFTTG
jgi:hypothetical protein